MKYILSILFITLFLIFPSKVSASVIFEDSFNDYPNNSFPSKWTIYNSPCNPVWKVESGILKIANSPAPGCEAHLIPNSAEWPLMLDEYVLEVDVRFISGVDRHISYRLNPQIPFIRTLHFVIPGGFALDADNNNYLTYHGKTYQNNITYHFRIVVTSNRITIYESDENSPTLTVTRDLIFNNPIPSGLIGLGSNPGSGGLTETWFDNVKVTTLDHEDEQGLDVSLLKQTDPLWANDIYDSANLWSSDATNMSRWGCAVTSATMVLQYNGITKLPDNSDLTPGTLNAWLKSVPDGYVRNGLVNWLAISRLTKQIAENNPLLPFDALEYKRVNGTNNVQLTSDIGNGIPAILSVPGHFVVAKGVNGITFDINDPFYARSLLTDYGNSYNSYGKYIPSNTDLSYLMFNVDPDVNVTLTDDEGTVLGEVFIQDAINDPFSLAANTVGSIKTLLFEKPDSDNYTIEISSPDSSAYTLDGYLYDQNGEVKILNSAGVVGVDNPDTYAINFNKTNVDLSNFSIPTTFTTLLNDVEALYQLGHITKKGSYNFLNNKIGQAEKYQTGDPAKSIAILEDVKQILIDDKRKGIDVFASQYLIDQINLLQQIFN